MTWRELLADAANELGDRHEARVLVEEVAAMPMSGLSLRLDNVADKSAREDLDRLVERRRQGEPLQHIVGHWPFRSIVLRVDGRALVPRPETEIVVDHVIDELSLLKPHHGAEQLVVDLGTGSGAIALSVAAECPDVRVIGVDRSSDALVLANENRARLSQNVANRVEFVLGDFYTALPASTKGSIACVVANPPYVSESEWLELDSVVRDFDPYEALVAGPTGLEDIEAVIVLAPLYLGRPGTLVVEIASHQGEVVAEQARSAGTRSANIRPDLAGRDRMLVARW